VPQRDDLFKRLLAIRSRLRDTRKKELDPVLYIVRRSHYRKSIVIRSSVPFKKVRKVKSWLCEKLLVNQVERYQKSANSPIAIKKGMDSFKLIMT